MANKYNDKLTPELQEKFCEAIEKGHSIDGACGYVGITEPTYYNWYNKGKESKRGKHRDFYCAVDKAKRKATFKVEQPIIDAIPTDIKTAQWWLVKHRPDTYAERSYTETKINADIKSEITVNLLERIKEKRTELDELNND